jgi:hypothetical protein
MTFWMALSGVITSPNSLRYAYAKRYNLWVLTFWQFIEGTMRIANTSLIASGNMTTALVSSAVELDHIYGLAVQAVYTGTPSGILKLQASCDVPAAYATAGTVPTNWTDITGASVSISAAGTALINLDGQHYNWVRLVFTPTLPGSNAGTLNARLNLKGA